MNGCLLAGIAVIALSGEDFRLEWTHSVEHVTWREYWQIEDDGLRLTKAAVKGSGAGMEPGPGAQLENGWWVWTPDLPVQPRLILAASGATGDAWHLCDGENCRDIGAAAGAPVILRPCP